MKKYFTNKYTKERRLIWMDGSNAPKSEADPAPEEDANHPDPSAPEAPEPKIDEESGDEAQLAEESTGEADRVSGTAVGDEAARAKAAQAALLNAAQMAFQEAYSNGDSDVEALAAANAVMKAPVEMGPDGLIQLVKAPEEEAPAEDETSDETKDQPDESTDETTDETTEEASEDIKDAPVGQIRKDTDGNHWQKGPDGMWSSVDDPITGAKSDSGYEGTQWGDSLMEERTESIVKAPETTKEIPPAKDAPVGQIRKDTDGNHWKKEADGMWSSVNDPENGMTSDSGYEGTKWGDTLMDERTESIVGGKEEGGDLNESNEGAPESIEKMVEALNGHLIDLIESNEQFMTEAPIGKVFTQMKYEEVDGEIVVRIDAGASAEFRSIMVGNGRNVTDDANGYSVEYPGEVVTMGESGGNYPSRLAWGGVEGDAASQFSAAKAGMDMWQSSVSGEIPEDTTDIETSGEEGPTLDEESSAPESVAKEREQVKTALKNVKDSLGEHVSDTHFGKFIAGLGVGGTVDGAIALTSDGVDGKTFSHMYQQLKMSGSVKDLTGSAEGGYTMVFNKGAAANIVHNLGRWAAMMGSKTESKLEAGDLGDGKEAGKDEDESSPEQNKEGEGILDENKEAIDIPKLERFAADLNKRRDTLQYSVEVSVDEEAGRILITAIDNEWGTAAVEGAAQLISIQAESEPRMMSATYTESGALSLDIRTKHEQHGYLGDITGEEFGEKPEADVEAPTLGGDGTEDGETADEDSEKVKADYEKAVKGIVDDVSKMRDHLATDTGASYINEDGSIDPESELGKMLVGINGKINSKDLQVPEGSSLGADLGKALVKEGHLAPVVTNIDQGSQIYMDENGINVERIKPEAPTTPTPTPPSTDINNSVDGIDTSNVENIA